VAFATLNDLDSVEQELRGGDVAAVILEAIQGVGGIRIATDEFLQGLRTLCTKYGTVLIMDEVQCGYGRTGWFFAHQKSGIVPDLVSVAKGMANGFPIGGVLISPQFQATKGMLGTTFGGNYLAMAGAHAVLDIIRKENLLENVSRTGAWLKANIPASPLIKEVRGEGLMLGIEFTQPVADIRKKLLFEKHIFTGVSGTSMIRLLAPLVLSVDDAAIFVQALKEVLNA
jgi:acetylornithine aminotransferase